MLLFGVVQKIFVNTKKLANVIVGILIRQNFQFMKVNTVNLNTKSVANFFYYQKLFMLPQVRVASDTDTETY